VATYLGDSSLRALVGVVLEFADSIDVGDLPPEMDAEELAVALWSKAGGEMSADEHELIEAFGRLRVYHHPSSQQGNELMVKISSKVGVNRAASRHELLDARNKDIVNVVGKDLREVMLSETMRDRTLGQNMHVTSGAGQERVRNSQLQGLIPRPFSTRFG
jgi:hypothetical protein